VSIAHLLNESVLQERVTARASDGQGGFPKTYTTVSAALRVRISSGSVQERERGGKSEAYYVHTLYAAGGANILRDDRMTRADGTQLLVVAVRQLSLRHHTECVVEEMRAGA
jgi:hypothetical protein